MLPAREFLQNFGVTLLYMKEIMKRFNRNQFTQLLSISPNGLAFSLSDYATAFMPPKMDPLFQEPCLAFARTVGRVSVCAEAQRYVEGHTHTHTHTHAHARARTHARTHARTYIHTYIHNKNKIKIIKIMDSIYRAYIHT